jgi:anti-sigma regulatory factor (Ser/Thr protein kinase)
MTLPAELSSLAPARMYLADLLATRGWADELDRVLLAASEGMSNAIEHGSRAGGSILVEVRLQAELAFVRVIDDGRPGAVVPTGSPVDPPIESHRGRGLVIMKRLADHYEVRPGPTGGTEVRLRFRREAGAKAARAA